MTRAMSWPKTGVSMSLSWVTAIVPTIAVAYAAICLPVSDTFTLTPPTLSNASAHEQVPMRSLPRIPDAPCCAC